MHSLVDTVIVGRADARSGTGCLAVRQTGRLRRQFVEFPMQTPPASLFSRYRSFPSFVPSQSHALSPSFKLYVPSSLLFLFSPLLLILSFLSFFSFRYAHPRERKSRHSRHFRFPRLDRELNFAGKFLSVVFCGEHR